MDVLEQLAANMRDQEPTSETVLLSRVLTDTVRLLRLGNARDRRGKWRGGAP